MEIIYKSIHSRFEVSINHLVQHGHDILSVITDIAGNVLFNDALNTFYLRLYGVRHMVKDHSDSEKGNLLPPLFLISSNGSFICTFPQTG